MVLMEILGPRLLLRRGPTGENRGIIIANFERYSPDVGGKLEMFFL